MLTRSKRGGRHVIDALRAEETGKPLPAAGAVETKRLKTDQSAFTTVVTLAQIGPPMLKLPAYLGFFT